MRLSRSRHCVSSASARRRAPRPRARPAHAAGVHRACAGPCPSASETSAARRPRSVECARDARPQHRATRDSRARPHRHRHQPGSRQLRCRSRRASSSAPPPPASLSSWSPARALRKARRAPSSLRAHVQAVRHRGCASAPRERTQSRAPRRPAATRAGARKWSRSVSAGLTTSATLSPRAAQQQAFHRQLELARTSASRFSSTSARRTQTSRGSCASTPPSGAASRTASPVPPSNSAPIWRSDLRSASPAGSAMSAAARTWLRSCRRFPAERLLLETDGPYLLPRNLQPKPASRRNEPAYLPHIAAAVARARGEPLAALARSSTAAARRLFALPACDA